MFLPLIPPEEQCQSRVYLPPNFSNPPVNPFNFPSVTSASLDDFSPAFALASTSSRVASPASSPARAQSLPCEAPG